MYVWINTNWAQYISHKPACIKRNVACVIHPNTGTKSLNIQKEKIYLEVHLCVPFLSSIVPLPPKALIFSTTMVRTKQGMKTSGKDMRIIKNIKKKTFKGDEVVTNIYGV